ncbi:hypothetical protein D1B33_08890 [Lysinibacillus yapensis]|uniref:CopC domain-containing protein n=1 Tax=Ureibacillus yapensis TaxID=2304605 RepID=A0A396SA21_9BACL|nr:copper resistance protein CopC [Lysinibacillus yapensis]RHW37631.1 hypothetical protein D1B33_08890 [Lysinibacillus yapensis]
MTQTISKVTSCLFIAFLFMFMSSFVSAHVFVVEETPLPNSTLESSPSSISIKFSNQVDSSFSIKVLDMENQEVDVRVASISEDKKTIESQLPQLPNGQYKVQYAVISSNDGHVIEGNYTFHVNWKSSPSINHDYVKEETSGSIGKSQGNDMSNASNFENNQDSADYLGMIHYIAKAIYYFGLLMIVGWILIWRTIKNHSFELRKKFLFFGMIFQLIHFTGLMIFLLVQMNVFTSQGISFKFDFPIDTLFGKLWIVSLIFSLAGFFFLFKNRLFDFLWVLTIVVAKSFNGHTQEFEPTSLLVALNGIHLFAAAIWAAGLFYMLLFWRKQQLYVKSFLPIFSKAAVISIVLLSVSGSIISYLYLPDQDAILTDWGIVLLFKIAAVLGVVVIGAFIRMKMKRGRLADLKLPIKIDFLLLIILIILVSILTSLNPLP